MKRNDPILWDQISYSITLHYRGLYKKPPKKAMCFEQIEKRLFIFTFLQKYKKYDLAVFDSLSNVIIQ